MARLAKLIELVTALTRHRTAPTSGGIEFAYEPRRDGDADPGEVVWSWVEFEEDPTQGKDRPVVIVGYWGDDLCGVPLTTKARPSDPDRVLVGSGRQLDDAPRPASSTGTWPAPPERPLGVGRGAT